MRNKIRYSFMAVCVLGFFAIVLYLSQTKLTYTEYKSFNTNEETYIKLSSNGESLAQEFVMPYDILDSIAIKIGTFSRDNNSFWDFCVYESGTGKFIYQGNFDASLITDDSYYKIKLKKRIKVERGEKYVFMVSAADVSDISALAFYISNTSQINNASFYYNGQKIDSDMCFKVYGGDIDHWWVNFIWVIVFYILAIIAQAYRVSSKREQPVKNIYIQGMLIGAAVFILLFTFAARGVFIDENDNMRGGMVIANGGILYKDYVTQHTPVVYYLCAVFALLGAGSVEQFRLSYYFVISVVWALIYIRNAIFFGRKKMVLLPIFEVVCITSIVTPQGYQVLSDGLQGILFVIILLEFIRYCSDKRIGWDRSIILSICIWGSFGAAFISVYALVWVALLVLIVEILYWKEQGVTLKLAFERYYKFFIALIVPFITAIVYFKVNHSLKRAFDQFYLFNRKVYPKYISGYGEDLILPFINGVQNFFHIITDNFNAILTATVTNVMIFQLVIICLAVAVLIRLIEKKKILEVLAILLTIVFSGTRGYGFHGLAAWYVALMAIVTNIEIFEEIILKVGKPLLGIILIVLLSTYIDAVRDNLVYEQPSVSELESQVIAMTEKDEDKDIFLDASCCDSLYFFYKDRKPVNTVVYMLPWYMDWYEKDDIYALKEKQPRIVVYNEDRTCWDYSHYTVAFEDELIHTYKRLGDVESGWEYSVWIRND